MDIGALKTELKVVVISYITHLDFQIIGCQCRMHKWLSLIGSFRIVYDVSVQPILYCQDDWQNIHVMGLLPDT